MTPRIITNQEINSLSPDTNNARTHSAKQIRQIAGSIKEFGFNNPVLVDRSNTIVAGHGRVEAAKTLGMTSLPTIRLEDLSPEQIRAYVIADNRLAELAGWDREILATEFQSLLELDCDLDLTLTGFEMPEIDLMIEGIGDEDTEEDDDIPDVKDTGAVVTRPGDIWLIGPHRLICADALAEASYAKLLEGEKAQMIFSDPPYNVPIEGNVSGKGTSRHGEFAMASGEMTQDEFTLFLRTTFRHLAANSIDGSIHYICMDFRHMAEILSAGDDAYSELKNLCVWAKTNGGMGSLYRSQHELVFVFKSGTARHVNNVQLGMYGRNRTNLWTYAGQNSFGKTRDEDLALHPTVKPVQLVADAILDCSERNGLILDAFAGSGTTLLAAHKTGRRGYGIELDPRYCDVIIERMQTATGLLAVHKDTGLPYSERSDSCLEEIAS